MVEFNMVSCLISQIVSNVRHGREIPVEEVNGQPGLCFEIPRGIDEEPLTLILRSLRPEDLTGKSRIRIVDPRNIRIRTPGRLGLEMFDLMATSEVAELLLLKLGGLQPLIAERRDST